MRVTLRHFALIRETIGKKTEEREIVAGETIGDLYDRLAADVTITKVAGTDEFKARMDRTLSGARIIGERLTAPDSREAGVDVLTGGTDVHLVLADLRDSVLDGKQAEDRLHEVFITVNRNSVPFDPRPPMVTSGVRLGTAAVTSRSSSSAASRDLPGLA